METIIFTYCSVAVILVSALIAWVIWSNYHLKISNYALKFENLPKSFNGFKVAHVSDFHNSRLGNNNEKLLTAIKNSNCDVIVITGDLIDSRKTDFSLALDFVDSAIKIAPIYYVTGNHESRIKEYPTFEKMLAQRGAKILRNEKEHLFIAGDKIILAGIDDPRFDKTCKNDAYVVEKTLHSMLDASDFNILLSHRPELIDTYLANNAHLVFSGHAHGGQFRIFGRGIYAPNQGFFPKYVSSVHKKDNCNLVVSKGLGNSAFPFRFNNPPELVLVTLLCRD